MEDEKFEVYVTKYALTQGIKKIIVRLSSHTGRMVFDVENLICYYGEGIEWHRTWVSALRKAIEMKRNKILSLKKSINRLESLEFKP